jgi:hypothetical protein
MVEEDWLRQAGTQDGPVDFRAATGRALELALATLDFIRLQKGCPAQAGELAELESAAARAGAAADWKGLYLQTRWLRRRIIFSHPALAFDRLLVNKCPPTMKSHMCDQCTGRWSVAGPGLCVLEPWAWNPRCRPLLEGKLPPGSFKNPDLSFDAKRVIFSFCDHTAPALEGELADGAVSVRRPGADGRRDADGLQSGRHARFHEGAETGRDQGAGGIHPVVLTRTRKGMDGQKGRVSEEVSVFTSHEKWIGECGEKANQGKR